MVYVSWWAYCLNLVKVAFINILYSTNKTPDKKEVLDLLEDDSCRSIEHIAEPIKQFQLVEATQ